MTKQFDEIYHKASLERVPLHQRFVSSTGNMEDLLSHTHSILYALAYFEPKNMKKLPSTVAHNRPIFFSIAKNSPIHLPRQLKTHIPFSMFPILDTNLYFAHM